MQIIDLSAPIQQDPPETLDALRTDINYVDHQQGAEQINSLLQVPARLLRNGEGWASETLKNFGTHNSTHVDAPWHYNSTIQGDKAQTIDQLPLELFYQPGVVLNMTAKADNDPVTVDDLQAALTQINHTLIQGEIVLLHTGRDQFYGDSDYIIRGCGVTAQATHWLFDQGIRVMGIDAWGWDAPLHLQAQAAKDRDEEGIFWGAHQADLPYCQIERLVNLCALPATGFTLCCFPLKIVNGSAGPARVVAIINDEPK